MVYAEGLGFHSFLFHLFVEECPGVADSVSEV